MVEDVGVEGLVAKTVLGIVGVWGKGRRGGGEDGLVEGCDEELKGLINVIEKNDCVESIQNFIVDESINKR